MPLLVLACRMRRGLTMGLVAGMVGCASSTATPTVGQASSGDVCADAARILAPHPAELTACSGRAGSQVVGEARFRLAGRDAGSLEAHLRRAYGMPPLRFTCCGWEAPGHGVVATHRDGSVTTITMHSDETLVDDRDRWREIPQFSVVAQTVDP
jgi:hypothetical protein